jgi:hypothetical protein
MLGRHTIRLDRPLAGDQKLSLAKEILPKQLGQGSDKARDFVILFLPKQLEQLGQGLLGLVRRVSS